MKQGGMWENGRKIHFGRRLNIKSWSVNHVSLMNFQKLNGESNPNINLLLNDYSEYGYFRCLVFGNS